ncbi:sulfotransferase [Pleurocapsales cyanobacterium LEGE 06147]|nr:sulfotransferase [Pleurocapsales cyanobacterium LEGE 06147]
MQTTNINRIPDEPYLDSIAKVNFSPVFIMGDHRSGTTLLYKLLAATKCFNFVKTYHIIKYNEILFNYINKTENQVRQELETLFTSLGISDRVFDKVTVNPDLPEEYGFILKNIAGDESFITSKNLPVLQQLCRKIQFVSDPDKPLLLKNPWDFPRFMYVKSIFPEAKFIFIHRHPIPVINSKLKVVRTSLSEWNAYTGLISQRYIKVFNNPVQRFFYRMLYSKYFNLGLNQVTKQAVQSTTYFLENIDSLPKTNYISVRYEDLCNEPKTTILKIVEFLELELKATLDYENSIEPRPLKLLPEVERKYDEICQKLKPYLDYQGYQTLSEPQV